MLHAGLDLSRRRLDVCLIGDEGEVVGELAAPPDADGLRHLVERVGPCGERVRGVIESMTGARFVHDTLEQLGWEVLIADAQKVKGLAPLACKTDRIDARVLAVLSHRDLVPAIWLPDPRVRARARAGALPAAPGQAQLDAQAPHPLDADHLRASPARSPICSASPAASCSTDLDVPAAVARRRRRQPVADRRPRAPDRRRSTASCSATGADHPYVPLLMTAPGIGWVLAFTIAAEIGEIERFAHAQEARRLHRPVPARDPVRRQRPPRPADQARARSTCAGRCSKRPCTRCGTPPTRPLPAHQAPPGQPARRQGRPDRHRPPAHRSRLAHAHPQPALRSRCGRRRSSSGRLTALLDLRPRSRPPIPPGPPAEEAIER